MSHGDHQEPPTPPPPPEAVAEPAEARQESAPTGDQAASQQSRSQQVRSNRSNGAQKKHQHQQQTSEQQQHQGQQVSQQQQVPISADYLGQLIKDKKQLAAFPLVFMHVQRLLDDEIHKVRQALFQLQDVVGAGQLVPLELPEPEGEQVQLQEKIYVPVEEHPEYNFVGRLLGPRGMTAKQLEQETGCKIMIRGRGSMRDKKKEEQNRGKANWEHLNDELHVLITVEDTQNRAELKMKRALEEVKQLLVPIVDGEDELKKRQLMELAIINGTYRDCNYNETLNKMLNEAAYQHASASAGPGEPPGPGSGQHQATGGVGGRGPQFSSVNGSSGVPSTGSNTPTSVSSVARHGKQPMGLHQQSGTAHHGQHLHAHLGAHQLSGPASHLHPSGYQTALHLAAAHPHHLHHPHGHSHGHPHPHQPHAHPHAHPHPHPHAHSHPHSHQGPAAAAAAAAAALMAGSGDPGALMYHAQQYHEFQQYAAAMAAAAAAAASSPEYPTGAGPPHLHGGPASLAHALASFRAPPAVDSMEAHQVEPLAYGQTDATSGPGPELAADHAAGSLPNGMNEPNQIECAGGYQPAAQINQINQLNPHQFHQQQQHHHHQHQQQHHQQHQYQPQHQSQEQHPDPRPDQGNREQREQTDPNCGTTFQSTTQQVVVGSPQHQANLCG